MSVLEKQLAPLLGLIDKPALPKAVSLVLNIHNTFQHVEIRGHSYNHSTIIAKGNAQAHFGDSSVMSQGPRYSTRNEISSYDPNAPLSPDRHDGAHTSGSGSASGETRLKYRRRDHAWFTPGRLFRIFAPSDVEIHEKQFILLDTKNKEGPGLLICTYDEEEENEIIGGYFLRSHVSVRNYTDPSTRPQEPKRNAVYMDEYEDHEVEPGTWIALEHTYNIPFAKYECVDYGMIDRNSLKHLRRCYVAWLRYHWGLG